MSDRAAEDPRCRDGRALPRLLRAARAAFLLSAAALPILPAAAGGEDAPTAARVTAPSPTPDALAAPRPDLLGQLAELAPRDLDGRALTRADLENRVVLVDVWATWCAPCLAELPRLVRLERALGSDLALVGVPVDQTSRGALRSFLLRHGVSWPQLWDGRGTDGPLPAALGVDSVPRTFLFDREGRLVGVDLRGEALEAAARALAARRDAPIRLAAGP